LNELTTPVRTATAPPNLSVEEKAEVTKKVILDMDAYLSVNFDQQVAVQERIVGLLEQTASFIGPAVEEFKRSETGPPTQSEEDPCATWERALRRHCSVEEADTLLGRFAELLDAARRVGCPETRAVFWECWGEVAVATGDPDLSAKVDALVRIVQRIKRFNEVARQEQRHAEAAFHSLAAFVLREVYRALRPRLSRWERRLFLLMYLPKPALGNRVPALVPVLGSFFTGMDEDTRSLLVRVLVFKETDWGERKNLDKELERRLRAYLCFYPAWLAIVQDADREAKRYRPTSIDRTCVAREGEDLSPVEIMDPKSPKNFLEWLELRSRETVEGWARKYCATERRARYVIDHFAGHMSQETIARREGVTQQAASKQIRRGLKEIEQGLRRDGELEM
jgi:hypothetical protein